MPATVTIIGTLAGAVCSQGDVGYGIPLNGTTAIMYKSESGSIEIGMATLLYDNRRDSMQFSSGSTCTDSGSATGCRPPTRLWVWGLVGAEVGDGLLNQVAYNRDHESDAGACLSLSRIPLELRMRYRYVDTYSDRFDSYWARYASEMSAPMADQVKGLAEEYGGSYNYRGTALQMVGGASKYGAWATTPYFFSPVYVRGIRGAQSLRVSVGRSTLSGDVAVDIQDRYLDHRSASENHNYEGGLTWSRTLRGNVRLTMGGNARTSSSEVLTCAARVADSSERLLNWAAWAGTTEKGCGHWGAELKIKPRVCISIVAAVKQLNQVQERDFQFLEMQDTVSYGHAQYRPVNAHLSAAYNGQGRLPVAVNGWYDLLSSTRAEMVDTTGAGARIRQVVHRKAQSSTGGNVVCKRRIRRHAISGWLAGRVDFGGSFQNVSVPWYGGAQWECGRAESDSIFASVKVQAAGPVTIAYHHSNGDAIESYKTKPSAALYASVKVPFIAPFCREHVACHFWVQGGPISLSSSQRFRYHPKGNEIGPEISARFALFVR
jgi:hypothetical protein